MTKKERKFKKKHGFAPSEWWNLDTHLLEYLLPRLRYFRKHTHGYPGGLTEKKWDKKLKKMIEGFELHLLDEYWMNDDEEEVKKNSKKVQKASKLFGKYLYDLWD